MANLIATTEGALELLTEAWNYEQGLGSNWKIGLFTNNVTVSDSTTLSALTEAAWTGYSRATPTWPTPTNVGGTPQSAAPSVTFTYTGVSTVTNYGFMVTNSTFTKLISAANFAAPVVLTVAQPSYSVQATLTFLSQY